MKRIIAYATAFLFAISLGGAFAGADVIWIPPDGFYEEHEEECRYEELVYVAEEELAVYASPEDGSVVERIAGGTVLNVNTFYTDENGYDWALLELENEKTGWFLTFDAVRQYNSADFIAAAETGLREYDGGELNLDGDDVLFYTYPNSGVYFEGVAGSDIGFTYSYTDEWGNEWAYTPYHMLQEGWICLNDPQNADLPVRERTAEQAQRPQSVILPEAQPNTVLIVCLAVAAVVIISAVLIIVLFGKKRKVEAK